MNKSGLTDSNFIPAYWKWGTNAEKPRFLHTMFRVKNVEASLRFYCEGLGMKVMDRHDFEAGRFSLIYLGYDGYDGGGALELTYNWDGDDGLPSDSRLDTAIYPSGCRTLMQPVHDLRVSGRKLQYRQSIWQPALLK